MKNRCSVRLSAWRLSLTLIFVLALFMGCSQHPKATTRDAMDFIKQVYTACNTKNSKRLAACEERMIELESANKISKDEIKSFRRVLDMAAKEDWEASQALALQYAHDQVR